VRKKTIMVEEEKGWQEGQKTQKEKQNMIKGEMK
jgi:hypothetical protein